MEQHYYLIEYKDQYGGLHLRGPIENLHIASVLPSNPSAMEREHCYVQLDGGKPIQMYTKSQIFVTDRIL